MNVSAHIERNRAVVARFLDQTHAGNLAAIDQTVAPGIVTHGFPCGHNPDSRESYKQFFRDFGAAFTNMGYRTISLVADDALVAARFSVAVDHTGPYLGIAPSDRRVEFTGIALYRLDDGLIAETWLYLDGLSFLGQIGAVKLAA
jgi:predicted ester cyclase